MNSQLRFFTQLEYNPKGAKPHRAQRKEGTMVTTTGDIRPLHREDFNAVVEIDKKVFNRARPDYYETNNLLLNWCSMPIA